MLATIESSITVYLFLFSAPPHGMWDLSSPTRDQPVPPAVEAQSLNHWTARKVPKIYLHFPFLKLNIKLLPWNYSSMKYIFNNNL